MKKNWLVLVGMAVMVTFIAGCFGAGTTKKALTLKDINPGLAKYQNDPKIDVLKMTKVEYDQVNKPNYDRFFRRSAKLYATVLVAQAVVAKTKESLKATSVSLNLPEGDCEAMAKAIAEKKADLKPDQLAGLKDQKEMLELTKALLGNIAKDGMTIVEEGKGFSGTVAKDFAGKDATKVPAVTKAVTESVSRVKQAIDEAPALVEEVVKLIGAVGSVA